MMHGCAISLPICAVVVRFCSGGSEMAARVTAIVAGLSGLSALLVTQKDKFQAFANSKSKERNIIFDDAHDFGCSDDKWRSKWDSNWDKMAPKPKHPSEGGEGEVQPAPTASRHLILIRHGQYEHWHKDSEKKVLTELGRQQASATGKRLKELGEPYTILYHSTMPRAVETAKLISESLPGVPVKSCDLMREGAPIRPDPPTSTTWRPEEYEFFRDSVRIEAAFRKYIHRAPPSQKEDSTEVLVFHANVIRYFVCRALQLPPEAWLRMSLGNGSITRMTIRPSGRVTLKALGSTGHMSPELITFS